MFSSGPPELPGLIAASVCSTCGRAPFGDGERTLERADDADADGVRQAERVADRHHPVARLHLRRVAELDFGQRVVRLLGQLDERAVGQRIAADDLARRTPDRRPRRRATPRSSVAPSTTWLLVRMKPALSMMKPVPAACTTCSRGCAGAAAPGRRLPAARLAEEALEQVVAAAAAAAEELGQVLRALPRLGPDVDDRRASTALAMSRNVVASTAPRDRRAVHRRRRHRLRGRLRRQVRAATRCTMPTASDATAMSSA